MDPLPLPLISWVFSLAGILAMLMGAVLLLLMYKANQMPGRNVDGIVWNDIILLGFWSLCFVAGMGMLSYKPWAPKVLEYLCWVLIVLTVVNSTARIKIMKLRYERNPAAGEFQWAPVLIGTSAAVVPILGFCAATIYTLHDPDVKEKYQAAVMAKADRE
jgi:hypothetical protein